MSSRSRAPGKLDESHIQYMMPVHRPLSGRSSCGPALPLVEFRLKGAEGAPECGTASKELRALVVDKGRDGWTITPVDPDRLVSRGDRHPGHPRRRFQGRRPDAKHVHPANRDG